MNMFKKLVLAFALVTVALPLEAMKRKADDAQSSNERNVRSKTEPAGSADRDGKHEVKKAQNNMFSKIMNRQLGLGKKFNHHDLALWVDRLPDNPQRNPDMRDKTDTIIQMILHAPDQLPNFIQLYRMLPQGIHAGSPRCYVFDELDKKAQKYYEKHIKDIKDPDQKKEEALIKEAINKLPAGYFRMKVRALQQNMISPDEVRDWARSYIMGPNRIMDLTQAPEIIDLTGIIERVVGPCPDTPQENVYIINVRDFTWDIEELLIQRHILDPIDLGLGWRPLDGKYLHIGEFKKHFYRVFDLLAIRRRL